METYLKSNYNKILIILVSVLIVIGTFFIDFDKKGEVVVKDSFEEAIVVFGVAKGLNAVISLAQGTEVGPPGLTITIGEVLDPINDLVEQFSWIMLASIASLGIQKILLNFVSGDMFTATVLAFLIVVNLWLFIRFKNDTKIRSMVFKLTIVLVFLRFSIPFMALANSFIYENYVKVDYNIELSKKLIEESSQNINEITNNTILEKQKLEKEDNSFIEKVKSKIDSYSSYLDLEYYESKLQKYEKATSDTSDYILNLMIAFIFKTIFFPLLFLFLLYQLLRNTFKIAL